jgi:hypothetical protein
MKAAIMILALLWPGVAGCAQPHRPGTATAIRTADNSGTPERFVDWLYQRYRHHPIEGRRPPWAGPEWWDESVYTPTLLALFARQAALATEAQRGEGGDEICQCLEWRDLSLVERNVTAAGEERAEVAVRFVNHGDEKRLRLILEMTPAGWRVADLVDEFHSDGLLAAMRHSVAQAERERAAPQ